MSEKRRPPIVGRYTREELALASRNSGMSLEALRYDVTPAGLHYLLIHFDIPEGDAVHWRLQVGGLVERPRSLGLACTACAAARPMPQEKRSRSSPSGTRPASATMPYRPWR